MSDNRNVSRRAVVAGIVAAPTLSAPTLAAEASSTDEELITLGAQRDLLWASLTNDHDEAMILLKRIDAITAAIVATPAKSLQGLYVKARATVWALENDWGLLNPEKESTENGRVAASVVRDLLRLGAGPASIKVVV
jgi:hypothetical protein